MRTRTRFALLFFGVAAAVMAAGLLSIYTAIGRDAQRRSDAELEALLDGAARQAVSVSRNAPGESEAERLAAAADALIAARSMLARDRVLAADALVRLAIEVAAILALVLAAAGIAFALLSRRITAGLDELAARACAVRSDRSLRFPASSDPDLDALSVSLNALLDLANEQERRLAEASRLEGWREVASFLAHQIKNPLAALSLAAKNAELALSAQPITGAETGTAERGATIAAESLAIVKAESDRLAALINRFRDLAPMGLESYNAPSVTDLDALLEALADRAQLAGAKVALVHAQGLDERGMPVCVSGDRGLIEQALWNLFANSIEASQDEMHPAAQEDANSYASRGLSGDTLCGTVRIEVSIAIDGDYAVTTVSDSNLGLDPSLIARLGQERTTTKRTGTGLGLILVRRILATLGGSLELFAVGGDSGGRCGLGARVRLPLVERTEE